MSKPTDLQQAFSYPITSLPLSIASPVAVHINLEKLALEIILGNHQTQYLFSNSLCSNENNLNYFRKQLDNKGKRKFSASRAVFSCNMLRGNKVTIFLL